MGDSHTTSAAPLERHVIHAALIRPVLFVGVEPAVAGLEVTTVFALLFVVGVHIPTVLLAAFYLTVVHSAMAWVARQDTHMTALYIRSLGVRDYYHPRPGLHGPSSRVRPAIPPHP